MNKDKFLLLGQVIIVIILIVVLNYFNTINNIKKEPIADNNQDLVFENKVLEWGAYVGYNVFDRENFEEKVGKKVNLQAVFIHWGNENNFPIDIAQGLNGRTLVIFWEAMDYNNESKEQKEFSYNAIINGDWDNYISSFAKEIKEYGDPVILIPFEEMNGDWYPWSISENNNSPEKHIEAYKHIHDLFNDVSNVKFGWTINADSEFSSNYYPGDEYIDYIGLNGFNFGDPWQSFNDIFSNSLIQLSKYNKPIYIFSFACAEGENKAEWIINALLVEIPKYEQIKGWIWFNENKEKDWRVWSDEESLEVFKSALP